jgi:hypothetical protein
MTGLASEETAIVLKTRWHPFWVTFFFAFRTFVTIDGTTSVLPWGEHVFHVEPGTHKVEVSLGRGVFVGDRSVGEARIQTVVAQGKTVHLRYRSPALYNYGEGASK